MKARLDKALASQPQLAVGSRAIAKRLIIAGLVRVNGAVVTRPDFGVSAQDEIVVSPNISVPAAPDVVGIASLPPLRVLYDANDLLILDKPAGVSVHPGAGIKVATLTDQLRQTYPELSMVGEGYRPGIVHRLDKDTSGVMLVAKSQAMYEYLKNAFAEHLVRKTYLALVLGVPAARHGVVDTPMGGSLVDFRKQAVGLQAREPKPALTEFRVLEALTSREQIDKLSLISVILHTGRTHQIRVHLAHLGHPVVGDRLYGGRLAMQYGLGRQFLHASKIEVRLRDGTWIEVEAVLADDLRQVLQSLGSKMVSDL